MSIKQLHFELIILVFISLIMISKSIRKLDDDDDEPPEMEDLKFYFDFYNYNDHFPSEWKDSNKNITIFNAIKNAAGILESYISIYKCEQRYQFNEASASKYIDSWDEEKLKFDSDGPYDFSIAVFFNFNEAGNVPASTVILQIGQFDYPLFTVIQLNKVFLNSRIESDYLEALMLHELTHVLGFHKDIITELLSENIITKEINEKEHYYINSSNVLSFGKKYFGCDTLEGVEIEAEEDEEGDIGPGSHWSSRILLGEYMTEFLYPEEQVISGFTLALLEDLGYIEIKKKYTGGLMRFGKNKGCEFVNDECIGSKKFQNEFYYPTNFNLNLPPEPSCSSGRLSRTVHKLYEYDDSVIPSEYQYFPDHTNIGGLSSTNYCPISEYESSETIFDGRCSEKGTPSTIKTIIGESLSENSFCALSSLIKTDVANYQDYSVVRAVCFKMFCSDESLTIQVGEDYFVCPKEGGKIDGVGFYGYLLCPDYNLICTGTTICNDMFDCINKRSEEKEFTYDYEIETSQDSSVYVDQPIHLGAESSSNNNICPLYCAQCDKNKRCIKCGPHYKFKNNICVNKIENCEKYNDDDTCKKCQENYVLVKGQDNQMTCLKQSDLQNQYYSKTDGEITYYVKCSDTLDNCFSCSSETVCINCMNNYGIFDDSGTLKCVDLSTRKYYYDTSSSMYKLCQDTLTGCNTCAKNSNSEIYCIQCLENYAILYVEPETCELESTLESNDGLFKDNDGKYYPCNDNRFHSVENCLKCAEKRSCNLCQTEYTLYNSNTLCLTDSDISDKKYYLNPTDNNYYLCSRKIDGCNKCTNSNTCIECKYEYGLDEDNKCIHYSQASKYYLDQITGRYISCSKIENCYECSSATQCLKCEIGFKLSNSICVKDENDSKYKAIATSALVISVFSFAGVVFIILLLLKRGSFFGGGKLIQNTTNANNEVENNNDIQPDVVKVKKRSIHNDPKDTEHQAIN